MGLPRAPRRPPLRGRTLSSSVSTALFAVASLPGCGAPKQVHPVENAPVEHVTVASVALPNLPDECVGVCTKTDGSTRPLSSQEKTIRGVSFTVHMPTEGFEEDTLLKLDNQLAYLEKGYVLSGIHISFSVFEKFFEPKSVDDAENEVNFLGDRKTLRKEKLGDGFLVATTNDKKTSLYVDTWTRANDDYSIRCSAYDTESSEIEDAAALQDWFETICSSVKSKVTAAP